MLRLLQEYPLDNDEFEWKWFGMFKFPNSTTLRNAGKILLQWRNELKKHEGTDSLNLILDNGMQSDGNLFSRCRRRPFLMARAYWVIGD